MNANQTFVPTLQDSLRPQGNTVCIRVIPIYGDAILAPMDGYSDWQFRSLCRSLGSVMSIANRGAGVDMMLKKEAI